MSSLNQIVTKMNKIAKEPFDWSELDTAILELHNKLTEPKWAIEDEKLRDEYEKLLVQSVVLKFKEQS